MVTQQERLENLDRIFQADLAAYCAGLVKIKDKGGAQTYFGLNRAQAYVDSLLRQQAERTGKVRAIILKARQLGMCLAPDTPVLTADLQWAPIGKIKAGDEIVAVDEFAPGGRGADRKIRTCKVEYVHTVTKEAFKLTLDTGVEIIATAEHRFLFKQRGGTLCQWRAVENAKVGDSIRYITKLWGKTDIEDAWFGGLLDGEGSLRPKARAGADLCVSQVSGAVLDRARRYLRERGYTYREEIDRREAGTSSKLGKKPVHKLVVNRMSEVFRLVGQTQPARFTTRRWWEGKSLPGKRISNGWAKVVAIEPVGRRRMIDLQTSTKTFIAAGIVSHNSTYIAARFYQKTTMNPGQRTFILTHEDPATKNLFDMAKRIHDQMEDHWKPVATTNNANELDFAGIDSGYRVGTAKNVSGLGRSSTIQNFHGSEVAFWAHADVHFSGVIQAVPDAPHTEIILESTANGIGGEFYELWEKAERGTSEYIPIFIPWFWDRGYWTSVEGVDFQPSIEEADYGARFDLTIEQLYWMHRKNVELGGDAGSLCWKFRQEYPSTPQEAFQTSGEESYIAAELVLNARKNRVDASNEEAAHVLGVDIARGGGDYTRLMDRCGRQAGMAVNRTVDSNDLMEVVGIIARTIDEHDFDMTFIDLTGMGAGVYDRLRELGYERIRGVNFGQKPIDGTKYRNKRAEMWGEMLLWFKDPGGVQIPDANDIHRHVCAPSFKFDSANRLVLEPKADIKKRLNISPDAGDALALTFAERVHPRRRSFVGAARGAVFGVGVGASYGPRVGIKHRDWMTA